MRSFSDRFENFRAGRKTLNNMGRDMETADYHSLSRQQLWFLCKKHGLPCRKDKQSMADSLSASFKARKRAKRARLRIKDKQLNVVKLQSQILRLDEQETNPSATKRKHTKTLSTDGYGNTKGKMSDYSGEIHQDTAATTIIISHKRTRDMSKHRSENAENSSRKKHKNNSHNARSKQEKVQRLVLDKATMVTRKTRASKNMLTAKSVTVNQAEKRCRKQPILCNRNPESGEVQSFLDYKAEGLQFTAKKNHLMPINATQMVDVEGPLQEGKGEAADEKRGKTKDKQVDKDLSPSYDDSQSSLNLTTFSHSSYFEFFVKNENGLSLYVDLSTATPMDWLRERNFLRCSTQDVTEELIDEHDGVKPQTRKRFSISSIARHRSSLARFCESNTNMSDLNGLHDGLGVSADFLIQITEVKDKIAQELGSVESRIFDKSTDFVPCEVSQLITENVSPHGIQPKVKSSNLVFPGESSAFFTPCPQNSACLNKDSYQVSHLTAAYFTNSGPKEACPGPSFLRNRFRRVCSNAIPPADTREQATPPLLSRETQTGTALLTEGCHHEDLNLSVSTWPIKVKRSSERQKAFATPEGSTIIKDTIVSSETKDTIVLSETKDGSKLSQQRKVDKFKTVSKLISNKISDLDVDIAGNCTDLSFGKKEIQPINRRSSKMQICSQEKTKPCTHKGDLEDGKCNKKLDLQRISEVECAIQGSNMRPLDIHLIERLAGNQEKATVRDSDEQKKSLLIKNLRSLKRLARAFDQGSVERSQAPIRRRKHKLSKEHVTHIMAEESQSLLQAGYWNHLYQQTFVYQSMLSTPFPMITRKRTIKGQSFKDASPWQSLIFGNDGRVSASELMCLINSDNNQQLCHAPISKSCFSRSETSELQWKIEQLKQRQSYMHWPIFGRRRFVETAVTEATDSRLTELHVSHSEDGEIQNKNVIQESNLGSSRVIQTKDVFLKGNLKQHQSSWVSLTDLEGKSIEILRGHQKKNETPLIGKSKEKSKNTAQQTDPSQRNLLLTSRQEMNSINDSQGPARCNFKNIELEGKQIEIDSTYHTGKLMPEREDTLLDYYLLPADLSVPPRSWTFQPR